MVKSAAYSKHLKELDEGLFSGTIKNCELIYSRAPFSTGAHEFNFRVEKLNSKPDHLYVVMLREDSKEKGGNFFSPYHCIFCKY